MARFDFDDKRRRGGALDMAPLIDVVFLLLIFFLLTSSQIFKTFDLNLPTKGKVKPAETDRLQPVEISLQAESAEHVLFDGIPVTLRDLGRNVYAHLPAGGKRTFIVKAEDKVPVQSLIAVMERVRAAGATDVRMARWHTGEDQQASIRWAPEAAHGN